LGCSAPNAAIHLGDGNGSARLPFDLVEEPSWDARSEGKHVATFAVAGVTERSGLRAGTAQGKLVTVCYKERFAAVSRLRA
jgi:hypothetical protein